VIEWMPLANALMNATSFVCLVMGRIYIGRGMIAQHRNSMVAALTASVLFLISYLVYHAYAGTTRFLAPPALRTVYLVLLGTHTVLAMVIVPMVLVTLWRALKVRYEHHRRIARWTLPLWMYVSATGVLIYLFLYVLFPQYAVRG
jgi:putative membrane protein